ncbi:MAG: lipid A deacylase LpxR family protein [Pseudobdellovibrio sp.]
MRSILYLLLSSIVLGNKSFAQEDNTPSKKSREGEAIVFYIENDSRNIGGPGSDRAYSNGFKLSYIYAEDRIPRYSNIPLEVFNFINRNLAGSKTNFGISLGHQIYTPVLTAETKLIPDDRPYAAWAYIGLAASFQKENSAQFFELDVGMVGPSALGKEVQNNFHNLIGVAEAQGWANTLHDEPTLQLNYQKRFQFYQSKNLDFIPYYGAGFGNVLIGLHSGGLVRLGVNLQDDYGPTRPSASDGDSFVLPTAKADKLSYYIYGGVRGNLIARNIFLDGNTFKSSHKVKKYPFNSETEFGLGLQVSPFVAVWRFVTRSPEFEERSRVNSFASLNISYLF